MDLYSLARRMARPFVFLGDSDPRLPLDARGIIGDGWTSALVRVDGVIDWACFPRFDSPSVFAGILDPDKGGSTSVTPVRRPFESLQRYDPDTNVLETLFRVEGQGVVRLLDYMPWSNDPRANNHEIHRRVQCLEGSVEMRATFDPRFDYGRAKTELELQEHGVFAHDGCNRMVAVLDNGVRWTRAESGGMEATFELRAGERRWMVLSWDAPQAEPIAAYRPFEHLRLTRHAWREYVGRLHYDGPWRHHVLRSALLLKLLQYAPTGAMVAAPTTSLPEWLGGHRNWDYRFTWTRDAAMAIRSGNVIGYATEARDFFHFIRQALLQHEGLQVMYTVDGDRVPEEEILEHLSGFGGSGPVRIGNAAKDQLQLDTVGALVDAAYLYERFGGALGLRTWRRLRNVVHGLTGVWSVPDDGIWEPRAARRQNVHSKVMCWLAFDRAARMAPRFGDDAAARAWARCAELVKADIRQHGVDESGRHFCAAYGSKHVDGALLVLPLHGFLEPDHPLIVQTIDRVREELGSGPFVHRYAVDDGVGGAEGAFVLCGFWLAEALAMLGRIEEAQEVFLAHAEASNHLGLLAEEIDPSSGDQLGNFPQAFSHLGLINAAMRIDLALRMRDEGLTGVPHVTQWVETKRR